MYPIDPNVRIDEFGNLHIPPRVIPPPSNVSSEARLGLSRWFLPSMDEWPPPGNKAAWSAFIGEGDEFIRTAMEPLRQSFTGTVKRIGLTHACLFEIAGAAPIERDYAVLYLHGGAYIYGAGDLAVTAALPVAMGARCTVFSSDYRMPPDHPFPAAVDDAVEAYRYLLDRYPPGKIGVMGLSAGAGLAAACILKSRDIGLPLAGAAVLFTPEADLSESGDSFETNRLIDVMIRDRLRPTIALYAAGHDLRDPYLSPVFADFSRGFPPTLLIAGTRDLFLSNTVLLHRALRRSGQDADLHIFEAMPHGGFLTGAPEDIEAMTEQLKFLEKKLS